MTQDAPVEVGIRGILRSVDDAGVVRLEGRFATHVDELWSALTDRARLVRWLGEVDGDLRLGGEFRARFFATGWEGTGRVEVCEPGRRLRILTKSVDEPNCIIEATLTVDAAQTLLTVEDRGLPREQLAAYGAGDQVLLEGLVAYLAGRDRGDASERWRELHPSYQQLAAACRFG